MTANFTGYMEWDPRWCKDEWELKQECPNGHVNWTVLVNSKMRCRTCGKGPNSGKKKVISRLPAQRATSHMFEG